MKVEFSLYERVLMIAAAVAIGAGIWWAAQAAPQGQCDPLAGAVVAVGQLEAGTPYPVPSGAVGASYGLVSTSEGGTPVVVLAPCP